MDVNNFFSILQSAITAAVNQNPEGVAAAVPATGAPAGLCSTLPNVIPVVSSGGLISPSAIHSPPSVTGLSAVPMPIYSSSTVEHLTHDTGRNRGGSARFPILSGSMSSDGLVSGISQGDVTPRIRQMFQPYDRADRPGNVSLPGTSAASSARTPVDLVQHYRNQTQAGRLNSSVRRRSVPIRTWIVPVVFLGDPSEEMCPDSKRYTELARAKLGKKPVTCNLEGSQSMLQAIMSTFMNETGDVYASIVSRPDFSFELHYIIGCGYRGLVPITSDYHPREIKAMRCNTLYARPSLTLLPIQDSDADADDEDDSSCSSSEFYEVVGGRPTAGNQSCDHNTTEGCNPEENRPEIQNVECNAPESNQAGHNTPRSEAAPAAATLPRELAGFRPDVTSLPDISSLRRFIFLTSGPQTIEISQLGQGLYPLGELSRFLNEVNPEQETTVRIRGENTIDGGGPLLAFIWKLTASIQDGKFNGLSLLYGKPPNCTLSADRCLVRDNVMATLARFTAFAILNTGKGLYGLSRMCVKILASTWWPTAADIEVSDLLDPEAKFAAENLQSIVASGQLDWRHAANARTYLLQNEWGYGITTATAPAALDFVKLYSMVTYREASLLQYRQAFLATDVGRWVSSHEHLWDEIFPPHYPTELSPADVMEIVDGPEAHPEVLVMLHSFLSKFQADGNKLSSFVEAVTGYPYVIGNGRIKVIVDQPGRLFSISTCFKQLRVTICTQEKFDENMELLLCTAAEGFNAL